MQKNVLCLLGPNGCGKGTVGKYLKALDSHIIVTSDVLEEEKKNNPHVAQIIKHHKEVLQENVPCNVAIDAVVKTFHKKALGRSGLFILDGMGRTANQIRLVYDRLRIKKPFQTMPVGFVFLTLSYEESMRRIEKRIQETFDRGEEPRTEDSIEVATRRFETYMKVQESLISTAREVSGWVTVFDLEKYTTLHVAAQIYAMTHQTDPEIITETLRKKFSSVA